MSKRIKSLQKRAELTRTEREIAALRRRIKELRVELYGEYLSYAPPAEPSSPTVSDHALVRYLERVHGLNFEPIRKRILTDQVLSAIDGGAHHVLTGTFIVALNGKTVVTILTNDMVDP
jgi:hypothetical protein